MFNRSAAVAALVLALAPQGVMAQARDDTAETTEQQATSRRTIWQAGTGISYSTGDYGGPAETEVVSIPVNLRLRRGDWSLRVAASYVRIDGQASVIDPDEGDGGTDGGSTAGTGGVREGLGDLSFTLAKQFDLGDATRLTAEVRAKFPTASEAERLTTGTTDITLRARLSQDVGDVTLRAAAQRRFALGQGRVAIRDTWAVSAGASLDLGDRISAGVDFERHQSAFINSLPKSSVSAFLSAPLTSRLRLTGYAGTGLSRNAADLTIGTSLSLRLD